MILERIHRGVWNARPGKEGNNQDVLLHQLQQWQWGLSAAQDAVYNKPHNWLQSEEQGNQSTSPQVPASPSKHCPVPSLSRLQCPERTLQEESQSLCLEDRQARKHIHNTSQVWVGPDNIHDHI